MTTRLNQQVLTTLTPGLIARNDHYTMWSGYVSRLLTLQNTSGVWPGQAIRGVDTLAGPGHLRSEVGGNHLDDNSTRPQFDHLDNGLVPIVKYDGSSDYHAIADATVNNAFNFVGTEGWVPNTKRGLAIGGWFYNDGGLAIGTPRLIGKGTTTGNLRHYAIYGVSATEVSMTISTTGADFNTPTTYGAASNNVPFPQDEWSFLVGRWGASKTLSIDSWSSSGHNQQIGTTGVPVTIANLSSRFSIAAQADGTRFVSIWASGLFAIHMDTPDEFFTALYEQSKVLFGHS